MSDTIRTRPATQEYRDGWERTFRNHLDEAHRLSSEFEESAYAQMQLAQEKLSVEISRMLQAEEALGGRKP